MYDNPDFWYVQLMGAAVSFPNQGDENLTLDINKFQLVGLLPLGGE